MTIRTINALATIVAYNAPFYASDLGLNGGNISALAYKNLIRPTGKTKIEYIELYDDYCKKVEVYEWYLNPNAMARIGREINDTLKELETLEKARDILRLIYNK